MRDVALIELKRGKAVVVVDDDDVSRRGMASLLEESVDISTVIALTHDDALGWKGQWADIDVVIVDASNEYCDFDQFPGVQVVERVRAACGTHPITIIAVTDQYFHDGLRRRMKEAQAGYFYARAEIRHASALYSAVLNPSSTRQGVPPSQDPEAEFCLGVTRSTRVNRAVAYAAECGLAWDLLKRQQPRSRRWLRLRAEFNRHARLTPVTIDGRRPDRAQELPSLPQMARFLAWATKVRPASPLDSWERPARLESYYGSSGSQYEMRGDA